MSLYPVYPPPFGCPGAGSNHSLSTGGGTGVDTVDTETSPMICNASLVVWYIRRSSSRRTVSSADSSIIVGWSQLEYRWASNSAPINSLTYNKQCVRYRWASNSAPINSLTYNQQCVHYRWTSNSAPINSLTYNQQCVHYRWTSNSAPINSLTYNQQCVHISINWNHSLTLLIT